MTDEFVKQTCRPGAGAASCRYLSMGARGWGCEKLTAMKAYLDRRVASGTFTAQGDNCPGVAQNDGVGG
jgi:hypothetical protein